MDQHPSKFMQHWISPPEKEKQLSVCHHHKGLLEFHRCNVCSLCVRVSTPEARHFPTMDFWIKKEDEKTVVFSPRNNWIRNDGNNTM